VKVEHVQMRVLDGIAEKLELDFGLIVTDRQGAQVAADPDPKSTVHASRHFIRH